MNSLMVLVYRKGRPCVEGSLSFLGHCHPHVFSLQISSLLHSLMFFQLSYTLSGNRGCRRTKDNLSSFGDFLFPPFYQHQVSAKLLFLFCLAVNVLLQHRGMFFCICISWWLFQWEFSMRDAVEGQDLVHLLFTCLFCYCLVLFQLLTLSQSFLFIVVDFYGGGMKPML